VKCVFIVTLYSFLSFSGYSQINDKVWNYIQQYHQIAVSEMQRTGIPASITLAQGLLESGIGESKLARQGNNHFGIKCHDWNGRTMRHDDDKANECFRVYASAYESYIDHSDFLKNRSRYSNLFQFANNDYVNWAKGLKACGYATNPRYAELLIERIEKYYLHIFDKPDWQELLKMVSLNRELSQDDTMVKNTTTYQKFEKPVNTSSNNEGKVVVNSQKEEQVIAIAGKPESETKIIAKNEISKYTEKQTLATNNKEEENTTHNEKSNNDSAVPTFTLKTINGKSAINYNLPINLLQVSRDYGTSIKELIDYNEVDGNYTFNGNENIFLEKKRKRYKGKIKKHEVKAGETLHNIAQQYGISTKHLKKFNGLESNENLKVGSLIKLKGFLLF